MNRNLSDGDFERLVQRIYRALESSATKVSWNEHIPDRDVKEARRQIDVLIERQDKKIMVECRHHNRPQDITWIEHLSAKRHSVGADGVIAVSSSGFTSTAIKKAIACGILTRELQKVSPDELKTWTNFVTMNINFMEFFDMEVFAKIPKNYRAQITNFTKLTSTSTRENPLLSLLNQVACEVGDRVIDKHKIYHKTYHANEQVLLDTAPVASLDVSLKARGRTEICECLMLAQYIDSADITSEDAATITMNNPGNTELITTAKSAFWTIDMSDVNPPPNCLFHDYRVSNVRTGGQMIVEMIGAEKLKWFSEIDAPMEVSFI